MVMIKNCANCIERFLQGEKGQRFFNIAYSLGAAIVIWGALFKILHLTGGNTLLCIGMGTEVLMFILTAFDRPPREFASSVSSGTPSAINTTISTDKYPEAGAEGYVIVSPEGYSDGLLSLSENIKKLRETAEALNEAGATLLKSYQSLTENPGNISDDAFGYAGQMADLNRNIAGLNTIYEIQLKSVSGQLDTIDRVNKSMKDIRDMYEKSAGESILYCEETEKMTRYMKQLNAIYEKMITAMTVNMRGPATGNPTHENPYPCYKD